VLKIRKNHGQLAAVKYMKSSQLALQKFIAGTPMSSLREIEPDLPLPRLINGLPTIIPKYDRKAIRQDSFSVIRFWNTLFALYKIISCPGTIKISTIIDPFKGDQTFLSDFCSNIGALSTLKIANSFQIRPINTEPRFIFLESSSPTSKVSWIEMISVLPLLEKMGVLESIRKYAENRGYSGFLNILFGYLEGYKMYSVPGTLPKEQSLAMFAKPHKNPLVGKLSLKEEAAGKIRVFALVDPWTQSILRPLHDSLFAFLAKLPNDGTFNQRKSVERCFEKSKQARMSFGYDLSAATDRLPISVQVAILDSLYGKGFGLCWSELLVKRSYWLTTKDKYGCTVEDDYQYAVGQPMGALSSWAMLAVSHHMIVQYCAQVCGLVRPKEWFLGYELLGDDIVIFHPKVAERYLEVMKKLGVDINLSKSVVSHKEAFEFAKVTGYKGRDVSPVSAKMFISQNTWAGRANILSQLLPRIKPKVIQYIDRVARKSTYSVGSPVFTKYALLSNMGMSFSQLLDLIISEQFGYKRVMSKLTLVSEKYLNLIIAEYAKGRVLFRKKLKHTEQERDWYRIQLFGIFFSKVSTFDIDEEANKLAKRYWLLVMGFPYPDIDPFSEGSPRDIDLSTMFYFMEDAFREQLSRLLVPFKGINRTWIDKSIQELADLADHYARIKEFLGILDRAWTLLDKPELRFRESKTLNINIVKFLRAVDRRKPQFIRDLATRAFQLPVRKHNIVSRKTVP